VDQVPGLSARDRDGDSPRRGRHTLPGRVRNVYCRAEWDVHLCADATTPPATPWSKLDSEGGASGTHLVPCTTRHQEIKSYVDACWPARRPHGGFNATGSHDLVRKQGRRNIGNGSRRFREAARTAGCCPTRRFRANRRGDKLTWPTGVRRQHGTGLLVTALRDRRPLGSTGPHVRGQSACLTSLIRGPADPPPAQFLRLGRSCGRHDRSFIRRAALGAVDASAPANDSGPEDGAQSVAFLIRHHPGRATGVS